MTRTANANVVTTLMAIVAINVKRTFTTSQLVRVATVILPVSPAHSRAAVVCQPVSSASANSVSKAEFVINAKNYFGIYNTTILMDAKVNF